MTDVFEDINKFATACDQEPSKENYDMYLNLIREEMGELEEAIKENNRICLLYTSPSPRDSRVSRMPSSA